VPRWGAVNMGAVNMGADLGAGAVDPPSVGAPSAGTGAVDTVRILLVGTALWCLALAVTLLVPSLHTGARSWWPWSCLVGVVGGTLAVLYVRSGRGNAAAA